ncbi:universal stress protein [Ideonella sp. B7]|uniref:universal stress protein n=1 Tax=Ideonella benzenivorans TaxID=2831643 RepID=UPI001CEDCA20|nr:universal stress protein [Ideonella benzenivorans]MCA6218048.1 universal stress protein [Ideonella benzenivorans]
MFQHILVPTDGSDLSLRAVAAAAEWARATGARVTVFHVASAALPFYRGVRPTPVWARDPAPEVLPEPPLDAAQRVLEAAGVQATWQMAQGEQPWQLIVEAAESLGCDLVFMASHGRHGLDAWLLGSETRKVLTHCRVPVLVYR